MHDVPVAALFRDTISTEWHRPRASYLAFMAVVVALLVAVVIGLSFDKRIAAVFVLLLVGGVGVANAVKSHIDRRLEVIAALKAVGATGRDVFGIYLAQVVLLAAIGSVIGLALGAAMPFAIVGLFGKLLPLPVIPAVHADELALSFVYGLLTALAFGLWPLGRVHDVPVAALFRDTISSEWHRPRWSYLAFMGVVVALLVAVVIGLSFDKRIAAVFVASSVVVFALLRGVAAVLMAIARRLPRTRFPCCGLRSPTSTGRAR